MSEEFELYCKIFVKYMDKTSAKEAISSEFQGAFEGSGMYLNHLIVEVHGNPDSTESGSLGDDFLFWPVIIELDGEGESSETEMVAETSRVLEFLWRSGHPAVAACDFEGQLPWGGGINRDFSSIEGNS
ncbi:hypothetical protein [Nocardiopsis sp. RV163]|uniref:hypothetical protein n=1 Tax=Nocardiopsis sp. RV163 TaxID=1661388 RepID=UPI00128D58EF|nr:hypothetical protein [Nocardiopsis sp. RV163]